MLKNIGAYKSYRTRLEDGRYFVQYTAHTLEPKPRPKRNNSTTTKRPAFRGPRCLKDAYRNSGYSRGHLVPFADFTSYACQKSTMDLDFNIVPQLQKINAGNWRSIEKSIRDEGIKRKETVEVFTGCLGVKEYIGGVVPVPKFMYKITTLASDSVIVACMDPSNYPIDIASKNRQLSWLKVNNSPQKERGHTFVLSFSDFRAWCEREFPTNILPFQHLLEK